MTTHVHPQEDPQDRVNDLVRTQAGYREAADDTGRAG